MSRDIKTKFKAGDIPTTGLQLDWTVRDADLARDAADDPTRPLYWPPRPPMPPGQQYCAATEYAVLQALRSHAGEPVDGKFTCRPKVATIARIPGLDPSTVRRYLKCLRERGVIKWRPWGKARLFEFNIKRLAAAAGKATADYANAETKRSEAEQSEEERLDKLWDADVLNASVVKAAPAASAADQAILNAIGDGPTMVDTTSEDYDLIAEAKAADAKVKAQEAAEERAKQAVAIAATKAAVVVDDPDTAMALLGVREIYKDLDRAADLPTDLRPYATLLKALIERVHREDRRQNPDREGLDMFWLVFDWALSEEWWLARLKEYKGSPINFLDRNFETIKKQYNQKKAKSAPVKKSQATKTVPQTPAPEQDEAEVLDNKYLFHFDAQGRDHYSDFDFDDRTASEGLYTEAEWAKRKLLTAMVGDDDAVTQVAEMDAKAVRRIPAETEPGTGFTESEDVPAKTATTPKHIEDAALAAEIERRTKAEIEAYCATVPNAPVDLVTDDEYDGLYIENCDNAGNFVPPRGAQQFDDDNMPAIDFSQQGFDVPDLSDHE